MENEQTISKPTWTIPNIKVYEVADLTLGGGVTGFDLDALGSM